MAHLFSFKRIFKTLFTLLLAIYTVNAFPSNNTSNPDTLSDQLAVQPGTGDKSGNSRLFPIPHVLCTGLTIGNLFHSCFPVGCICTEGRGICNLVNKCVKTQLSFNFNKELDAGAEGEM